MSCWRHNYSWSKSSGKQRRTISKERKKSKLNISAIEPSGVTYHSRYNLEGSNQWEYATPVYHRRILRCFQNLQWEYLPPPDKVIDSFLSFFWLWIGIVYHIIYFSVINKAAYFFGALFILQGIIFFIYGNISDKLLFRYNKSTYNYVGIVFILYALIVYPILGHILGHQYPRSPTFGLPCPTTIFTFGVLLFIDNRISIGVLIIPVLWSIIGFGAALNLSIYEDFGLLLAGLVGFSLLVMQNKKINYTVKKV